MFKKKTFIASASLRIHYLEIPGDSFITWRASIPGVWKKKTHQVAQLLQICLSKSYWPNSPCHSKKVVLVKESSQKILSLGLFFIGCLNSGIRIAQIFDDFGASHLRPADSCFGEALRRGWMLVVTAIISFLCLLTNIIRQLVCVVLCFSKSSF